MSDAVRAERRVSDGDGADWRRDKPVQVKKVHFTKIVVDNATRSQSNRGLIIQGAPGRRQPTENQNLGAASMLSQHGASSRAESFLEKLRQHVHHLLNNGTNYDQMFISTRDEARRRLPAISKDDGERIADFVIEQVCEDRLTRKRTEQGKNQECKVVAFPGGRLRARS